MTDKAYLENLSSALAKLGLNLPDLNFVQRDSLSALQSVSVHEVDRTPVFVDAGLGPGGLKEKCSTSQGFDVGGKSSTGTTGHLTWKLSNYVCENPGSTFLEPASFVATAQSESPVVMTTKTLSSGDDLVIKVFSWLMNGNPAPNVRFTWRCWCESPFLPEP
jgi:hypothetical protein